MGLSRTVSEIDVDFSLKSPNFPHPLYFASPLKEFPLELGIGAGRGQKNQNDVATWPRKIFDDIFSRLDTIHQSDGQTDTWRQQRPRLSIASLGKNYWSNGLDIMDQSTGFLVTLTQPLDTRGKKVRIVFLRITFIQNCHMESRQKL